MSDYKTPYDEYDFILHDVLKIHESLDGYDPETTGFMLETAGNFAEKELAPLYNKTADENSGAKFSIAEGADFGQVTLAEGYEQAYATFIETTLQGIVGDPEYSDIAVGQPHVIGAVIDEILHSANGDLALIPTLTHSVYNGIYSHGTEQQKRKYLHELSSGISSGVMAMTENNAGSDLSNTKTFATEQADGSFLLDGQKIFISGGDNHYTSAQDSGNIIHLVLARIKDVKTSELDDRVTMFIAPKIIVDDNGTRTANSLGPIGIEHKMGMAGSATCTMLYKGAKSEIIGQRGKGIATMFAVMNEARNHVARQAIGCAEAAFQKAWAYATNEDTGRRMGRAATGAQSPDKEADLIVVHPAVRKLLLNMRSKISGARMLQIDTALQMDLAENSEWVSLMTNVVKAHITDIGSEVTDSAIQIFGGSGFIEESGVARHYRDVRVTRIYEGTNQIQAVTLLRQMKHMPIFINKVQKLIDDKEADILQPALDSLKRVTSSMEGKSYDEFAAGADELLKLIATVALGYYHALARNAAIFKLETASEQEKPFLQNKITDAEFYFAHILSNHLSLEQQAMAGLELLEI